MERLAGYARNSNTVGVVEPGVSIKFVSDESEKEHDFVGWPTDGISTAHHHWRHGCVATGFACGGTFHRKHL